MITIETLKYLTFSMLLIMALASDIKSYKIKNSIVYTFMPAGLIVNLLEGKWSSTADAILGLAVPATALLLLYALRMLGAGDIKLFCAAGAIMGCRFVLELIAFSFLAGALMALGLMIFRKNGKQRIIHLTEYIKSCFLCLSLLPYSNFDDKTDRSKFRFSYAVAFGAVIEILQSYFTLSFL